MGTEIERKFLVKDLKCIAGIKGSRLRQGYLLAEPHASVRIRTTGESVDDQGSGQAFLTVKGAPKGLTREEFEYELPPADANAMLAHLCLKPLIEKTRYKVYHKGHCWEVDVFHGDHAGLVMAEVELGREDEGFEKPAWLGDEVTGDPRYFNARLFKEPPRSP